MGTRTGALLNNGKGNGRLGWLGVPSKQIQIQQVTMSDWDEDIKLLQDTVKGDFLNKFRRNFNRHATNFMSAKT